MNNYKKIIIIIIKKTKKLKYKNQRGGHWGGPATPKRAKNKIKNLGLF
jgi:hypothetical protein